MKIMLIGGNGLIGSFLAAHLVDNGHKITVVDGRSELIDIDTFNGKVWIDRNIYTDQGAQEIFDLVKPDAVIFCASTVPDADQALNNPSMTMRNLQTLTASFYAALAAKVKRFIYLSEVPTSLVLQHKPLALQHAMAEEFLANSGGIVNDMDTIVLKLTNVYAAGTTDKRSNFLNDLLKASASGETLKVNLHDRADYVHIKDVVNAITGAVEQGSKEVHHGQAKAAHKGQPAVYYISSGQPAMARIEVIALYNRVATEQRIPTVKYVHAYGERMPEDMAYEESDTSSLILLTGIDTEPMDLEQGINKLIAMERLLRTADET